MHWKSKRPSDALKTLVTTLRDCMVVMVSETPPKSIKMKIVGPRAAEEEYNSDKIRVLKAVMSNQALPLHDCRFVS